MGILTILLTNLPAVIQAIVLIEQQFGKKLPGPAKKQLVMNAVQATGVAMPEEHVRAFSDLIDTTVKDLKNSGTIPPTTGLAT